MAYDLEEQEQLAALKAWWAKYGVVLLGVLTLVALSFVGWNGWNWYQRDQAQKANAVYVEFEQAAELNDLNRAKESASIIQQKYSGTIYGTLTQLHMARLYHLAGEYTAAREALEWVISKSGRDEYTAVARVRLSGVLLDTQAYDEALKVLEGDAPSAHAVAFLDRKGDVHFATGKTEEARLAWLQAVALADPQHPLRVLVQFKLDALPPVGSS